MVLPKRFSTSLPSQDKKKQKHFKNRQDWRLLRGAGEEEDPRTRIREIPEAEEGEAVRMQPLHAALSLLKPFLKAWCLASQTVAET